MVKLMNTPVRVALLGAAAIVAFDLLASLAAREIGFSYARASIGSYIIYFAIGFFAARASGASPLRAAAIAGAAGGAIDATIGWAVSWIVGPGRLPHGAQLTVSRWLIVAIFVTVLAACLATLGGLAGRRGGSAAHAA